MKHKIKPEEHKRLLKIEAMVRHLLANEIKMQTEKNFGELVRASHEKRLILDALHNIFAEATQSEN